MDAAAIATGEVRECLLHPERMIRLLEERRRIPKRQRWARVHATDQEWELIVTYLYSLGIVAVIEEHEVFCIDGEPVLNGAFGVPKPKASCVPHGDLLLWVCASS